MTPAVDDDVDEDGDAPAPVRREARGKAQPAEAILDEINSAFSRT